MKTRYGYSLEDWNNTKKEIKELLVGQAKKRRLITYKALVNKVRTIQLGAGSYALFKMLGEILLEENSAKRGMLTAVVVQEKAEQPGSGFYKLAQKFGREFFDKKKFWEDERNKLCEYYNADQKFSNSGNKKNRAKGRIKSGEGTLIGNAGEYYVVAELLKRGVIAALAPRNTPSFDILATKGEQTVRIRVKTKSQDVPIWQYSIKKDGSVFRHLSENGDFTVLVDLAMDDKDLKFYIVPTQRIERWLKKDFEECLMTPGKNGHEHAQSDPKRNLDQEKHRQELDKYLSRWDILWTVRNAER